MDAEGIFNRVMEEVVEYVDTNFTAEEGNGKYLDLHSLFLQFCNIKKLRKLNVIKCDDYLTWLQNFDKLQRVPLYLKGSKKYGEYLISLKYYLQSFFKKTQPLVDWSKIEEQTEEMFDSEWE